MKTVTASQARQRGRPPGMRSIQRSRLLQAAGELLAEPGGGDFSLRRVTQRAGVTAALANYYFVNRDGLLAALVQERAAPRIDDLISATRVRATQPVTALTFLLQRMTSLAATDALLRSCLLLPAGRPLRDRLRALTGELLQRAQAQGQLRADLPVDYLSDTLLGISLFPFLESAGNTDNAAERAAALTLHHIALLQDGIVRVHRPRQESGS